MAEAKSESNEWERAVDLMRGNCVEAKRKKASHRKVCYEGVTPLSEVKDGRGWLAKTLTEIDVAERLPPLALLSHHNVSANKE